MLGAGSCCAKKLALGMSRVKAATTNEKSLNLLASEYGYDGTLAKAFFKLRTSFSGQMLRETYAHGEWNLRFWIPRSFIKTYAEIWKRET